MMMTASWGSSALQVEACPKWFYDVKYASDTLKNAHPAKLSK